MFALNAKNVGDVVAICRAVEGSPLAIELAAAQITRASPAQIRAALEHGAPGTLGGAPRDHVELRAARRPISSACCASSRSCPPA